MQQLAVAVQDVSDYIATSVVSRRFTESPLSAHYNPRTAYKNSLEDFLGNIIPT